MRRFIYSFFLLFCALTLSAAEQMIVGTYNIRYANRGDSIDGNGWGQRSPYIAQLVRFHGFDILGTQEGKYPQLQDRKRMMPGFDYMSSC